MTDITYLQVVNEIRRVAAEQPDFVYTSIEHADPGYFVSTCVYVEQVAPNSYKKSCIVGHALVNLGVPPQDLVYGRTNVPGAGTVLFRFLGPPRTKADAKRRDWIEAAQGYQDLGNTWGLAVQIADENIADYEAQEDVH